MDNTKDIAKLRNVVDPKYFFWLNNGESISSIDGLIEALENMDEDLFRHHVNEQKNDFSDWVNNCLNDKELASLLAATLDKSQMIDILKGEIIEKEEPVQETEEILEKEEPSISDLNADLGNLTDKIEQRKDIYIKNIISKEQITERQRILDELLESKDKKLRQKEEELKEKDQELLARISNLSKDELDHERTRIQIKDEEDEINQFIKDKQHLITDREILIKEKDTQLNMERSDAQTMIRELEKREADLLKNEELLLETKGELERNMLRLEEKEDEIKEEGRLIGKQRDSWNQEEKNIISQLRTLKIELGQEERRKDKLFNEIHNIEAREKAVSEKEKDIGLMQDQLEHEKDLIEQKKTTLKDDRETLEQKEQAQKERKLDIEMESKKQKEEERMVKARMADLENKKALIQQEEKDLMKQIEEKERKLDSMEDQIEAIQKGKDNSIQRERQLTALKEKAMDEYRKFNEKIISLTKKEKELDKREHGIFEREVKARRLLEDAKRAEKGRKVNGLLSRFNIGTKPSDPLEGATKTEELNAIKEGEKHITELSKKVDRVRTLIQSDEIEKADKESIEISEDVKEIEEKGKQLEKVISLIDQVIKEVKKQKLDDARRTYQRLKKEYDKLEDYEKHTLYEEVMELYHILKE